MPCSPRSQAAHPTPKEQRSASTALHAALRSIAALMVVGGGDSDDHPALRRAHPNRRNAFRRATNAPATLPPSVAIPVRYALSAQATNADRARRRSAREGFAIAARGHGPLVLDILESCTSDVRAAMLPGAVEGRSLAASDPPVAHDLAYALQDGDADVAPDAPAAAEEEMTRIWRLMPEALQSAVPGDRDALASAPPRRAARTPAQTLRSCPADDTLPLPALRMLIEDDERRPSARRQASACLAALRMLIEDDERRRARGAAIPTQRPDLASALLPLLRKDLHALLACDPRIVVAIADLPLSPSTPMSGAWRRRR